MFSTRNKRVCRDCRYSAACLVDGRLRTLAHVWKSVEEAMIATPLPCEFDAPGKADESFRRATQEARVKLHLLKESQRLGGGSGVHYWNRKLSRAEIRSFYESPLSSV